MDSAHFLEMLLSFSQLSALQLERAQEHLRYHLQKDQLHHAISEQQQARIGCPHCQNRQVIHWGKAHDLQRYRCKGGGKTFTSLHHSALSGLHCQHKWARYADCMAKGLTLRAVAKVCHINLKTSFRWRHRFLRYALTTGAPKLTGIIEADEIFIRESFKGSRHLARPARHHGGTRPERVPLVPVLIALDRHGQESDHVLLDKSYQQIAPTLQPLLSRGSILCTDGNQSYIKIAEEAADVIHKRLISCHHHRLEDEVYHIQTLNNYVSRWRGWMQKFNGVGTDYLASYLAWFRVFVQEPNTVRSWLTGGVQGLANT